MSRFVTTAVHVRRYAPLYAAAMAWLLVIALIDPVGTDEEPVSPSRFSGATGLAQPAGSTEAVPPAAPTGADAAVFSSTTFSASSELAFTSEPDAAQLPSYDDSSTSSGSFAAPDSPSTPVILPLRIKESGYASTTAGTPLEQQPANGGLPVTGVGGRAERVTFVRLVGDTKTLKLAQVTDAGANVNDTQAVVKICPISTSGWTASRAQTMSAAPKWETPCVSGVRDTAGVWTFDLADYEPARANGWALVPPDNVTQNSTFQVVFKPAAVTS